MGNYDSRLNLGIIGNYFDENSNYDPMYELPLNGDALGGDTAYTGVQGIRLRRNGWVPGVPKRNPNPSNFETLYLPTEEVIRIEISGIDKDNPNNSGGYVAYNRLTIIHDFLSLVDQWKTTRRRFQPLFFVDVANPFGSGMLRYVAPILDYEFTMPDEFLTGESLDGFIEVELKITRAGMFVFWQDYILQSNSNVAELSGIVANSFPYKTVGFQTLQGSTFPEPFQNRILHSQFENILNLELGPFPAGSTGAFSGYVLATPQVVGYWSFRDSFAYPLADNIQEIVDVSAHDDNIIRITASSTEPRPIFDTTFQEFNINLPNNTVSLFANFRNTFENSYWIVQPRYRTKLAAGVTTDDDSTVIYLGERTVIPYTPTPKWFYLGEMSTDHGFNGIIDYVMTASASGFVIDTDCFLAVPKDYSTNVIYIDVPATSYLEATTPTLLIQNNYANYPIAYRTTFLDQRTTNARYGKAVVGLRSTNLDSDTPTFSGPERITPIPYLGDGNFFTLPERAQQRVMDKENRFADPTVDYERDYYAGISVAMMLAGGDNPDRWFYTGVEDIFGGENEFGIAACIIRAYPIVPFSFTPQGGY